MQINLEWHIDGYFDLTSVLMETTNALYPEQRIIVAVKISASGGEFQVYWSWDKWGAPPRARLSWPLAASDAAGLDKSQETETRHARSARGDLQKKCHGTAHWDDLHKDLDLVSI